MFAMLQMTWKDALDYCSSKGWTLATIRSKEESDQLKSQLIESGRFVVFVFCFYFQVMCLIPNENIILVASNKQLQVLHFNEINISSGNGANFWIGAMKVDGNWVWFHRRQNLTYTDWESGQPDSNTNGDGTEDCVHLWNTQGYRWNDSKCNFMFYTVCEEYNQDE